MQTAVIGARRGHRAEFGGEAFRSEGLHSGDRESRYDAAFQHRMGGIGIVGVEYLGLGTRGIGRIAVKSAEVVPAAAVVKGALTNFVPQNSPRRSFDFQRTSLPESSVRVSLMDAVSLTEPCTEGAESVVASSEHWVKESSRVAAPRNWTNLFMTGNFFRLLVRFVFERRVGVGFRGRESFFNRYGCDCQLRGFVISPPPAETGFCNY